MFGSSDRGSVLVLALWSVVVAALAAASVIAIVRVPQYLARNAADQLTSRMAHQSAVNIVLKELVAGMEARPVDGETTKVSANGSVFLIVVQDEAGKIDLNTASDEVLGQLILGRMSNLDQRNAFVDVLRDWRDPDDFKRLNGAERKEYLEGGFPYSPRNRALVNVEELSRLRSGEASIYPYAAPLSTVYAHKVGVDFDVAPLAVLRRFMNEVEGRSLIRERRARQTADGSTRRIGRTFSIYALDEAGRGTSGWKAVVRLTGSQKGPTDILAWEAVGPEETAAYFSQKGQF